MRIVGGRLRGRPLASPVSGEIRPTSDRLREAIFNILLHAHEDAAAGARVLDLFAGTGAMGLEALSRGAAFATFVDTGHEARGIVRQNIDALGLGGAARLFRRDATRMGTAGPGGPASLIFCDPPYGQALAAPALASCLAGGWMLPGALAVVEERVSSGFVFPEGIRELERRIYGETEVSFGRVGAA